MEQFFINSDTLEVFKEAPTDVKGNFAVVTSAEELVDQFGDKTKMQKLISNVRGKALKGDEQKSLKKLAIECFKLMTTPEAEKKAPKEKKPPKVTKVSIARRVLGDKGTILKKDLAEAVGHDLSNCHTMISILKNASRTKEPLFVAYNKSTTEYTLCKTKEEMVEKEEGFTKAIADSQAQANLDKKAKKEADDKAVADKKSADEKAASDAKAAKDAAK